MSDKEELSYLTEANYDELLEPVSFGFGWKRRSFLQLLGAGLMLASASPSLAQRRGGRGGFGGSGAKTIAARVHIGADGSLTVMTGKVEGGQGARAELTQAAAEELRVPVQSVQLLMADTAAVPDDGMTAGSGTSPRTVPAVRQGTAAARQLLIEFASKQWSVPADSCEMHEGKVTHKASSRSLAYADLAKNADAAESLKGAIPSDVTLTPVKEWNALGKPASRPNGHDIVTGAHQYPSDISRPGMLYGKVLRPPSFGAKLASIDLAAGKTDENVAVVRDEDFVGVAAPTLFQAERALEALSKTAKWETIPQPSSESLADYLKKHAQGGIPENPFKDQLSGASKVLKKEYEVAYVQHSPLEPRVGVAEWTNGKVTVWAGTQSPFGHRSEVARALHVSEENVRVIVPDFGAAFGGKHTGESSVEAARLAKAAGKPVSLRWTRQEEFTWAYFRPAGVLIAEAGLDAKGKISSWHFININSGPSAVETPYQIEHHKGQYIGSNPPLRHGSYRALASTANNFGRECFMDELAAEAGADPLEFRLAHLENPRLKAVLEAAAKSFGWNQRYKNRKANVGVGLACGTEKGSFVAACAEIEVTNNAIQVRHVSEAFECGAILNPDNLRKQVAGAVIMGLGPALREQMIFQDGKVLNAAFKKYEVPRFQDVPEIDIQLLDRPDLPSAGAGETPIICIAPAIANALFYAAGKRSRQMPLRV